VLVIPLVDRVVKVPLRIVTMDIPKQEVITSDNVTLKVNAVLFFRVIVPERAIVEVENYIQATFQYAQTTMRSVLGQSELDDLLARRDKINQQLQQIIDEHTEGWGIKVTAVEVKDVELPEGMQRAMARQAEADRERRAKIIAADGEFQAAEKLSQAAEIIGRHSNAIQLRFLQTLAEMASEKNTHTVVLPIPIDFLGSLIARRIEEQTQPASLSQP
jgi:regulator of protease activity HflC (stomatin/prohibitin superfamily)